LRAENKRQIVGRGRAGLEKEFLKGWGPGGKPYLRESWWESGKNEEKIAVKLAQRK